VPSSSNLAAGELAINTADGKLFYKDSGGTVQTIASKAGNVNVASFSGGTTGLTPNTATTGAVTLAGTLAATNGGTGQTSYAVGDLLYAPTTTTVGKLADVATGYALISGGVNTAPSYGKIGLTTHVSGTLPIANGGTNSSTSPTNGGIVYGTATAIGYSAAGTSGQVLISAGAAAPTWSAVTGTGSVVKATSPTLVTPALGTPASGVVTNLTGTASININGTVGATTANSGAFTTLSSTSDATIHGLTVGLGASAVADNTVVGYQALPVNTIGAGNSAFGYQALLVNSSGNYNTAIGGSALGSNTTGTSNTAIGTNAAGSSVSGSYNIAIGIDAYQTTAGSGNYNICIGHQAGVSFTTGDANTCIGYNSGYAVTSGNYNVILGAYSGNAAPISNTGSNWIVLSDGAGNVRQAMDATSVQFLTGAVAVYAPTPASFSAAGTLTNANLQTQILTASGTSYTLTMPLGTTLDTLISWSKVDIGFDFSLINLASAAVSLGTNTGVTNVGILSVTASTSARFRIRRTAASTYIVYRLS
jgi:hypothetical protein